MKIAYFDTNVFDHLYKKVNGITVADEAALRAAVMDGKISIRFSILNLEEILPILERESRQDVARAEMRLVLDLADWQNVIKQPGQLVSDDIGCYAQGSVLRPPFIEGQQLERIQDGIRQMLLAPGPQDIAELLRVAKETRAITADFRRRMEEGQTKLSPLVEKMRDTGQRPPSFAVWQEKLASSFVEAFAERVGVLEACKARGIEGLLDIRSVQMAVGVSLSLVYSKTFEGRIPKLGDSRDMQHAILAAASTDTLVSHDEEFTRLLPRIRIPNFQALTLRELLRQVR